MNIKRKMLFILGIVAMTASSLGLGVGLAGAQAANEIETTITVLDTACSDNPTAVTWSADGYSIPDWTPRGNPGEFLTTPVDLVTLNLDVSDCVEAWTLTGAMTDLTSAEGNTISTPDHFTLRVNPFSRARQISDTELCMFGTCWYPAVEHLGTSSPVPYGSDITFGGDGPAYASNQVLLNGDDTATGEMFMSWQARLRGIEHIAATTPPGTYTGQLTVTFTPTAP